MFDPAMSMPVPTNIRIPNCPNGRGGGHPSFNEPGGCRKSNFRGPNGSGSAVRGGCMNTDSCMEQNHHPIPFSGISTTNQQSGVQILYLSHTNNQQFSRVTITAATIYHLSGENCKNVLLQRPDATPQKV
mmetsp:Transcript_6493/g.11801  ORF Transcript_6493/g.11801 Transcript_6493/m.11801 type:complete len:130 (+) Transcript_6493:160-549(+)